MIAAGSDVPNSSDWRGVAGSRSTGLSRRGPAASAALVLLSCLLIQGCGISDNEGTTEAQPPARPAAIGGETIVPRTVRAADATRDSFDDRYPRMSFAERFSPIMGYAAESAHKTVLSSAAEPARRVVTGSIAEPARKIVTASAATGTAAEAVRKAILGSTVEPAGGAVLGFAAEPAREILFGPRSVGDTSLGVPPWRGIAADRVVTSPSRAYKVAALSPVMPDISVVKQANTRLIGFENSAFPYSGSRGGRYSDNRVLVHVPAGFDARKPGVIVVFFHGHGATLSRDVRDRQLLPAQITESGVNAVLVAPQLAYDAADSSAGKFWERDGFKRFMGEAADQLARVYGDPRSAEIFANMPVVIVAYSGGFETAASCLSVGGLGKRVTGVVLMDAIYGHLEQFASWIAKNRHAFFISSYTEHNRRRDDELAKMLRDKGIAVRYELDGPIKPGMVALLSTRDGVNHRSFVTRAWTEHPVSDILLRLAQR
jgi:hypothetical protein